VKDEHVFSSDREDTESFHNYETLVNIDEQKEPEKTDQCEVEKEEFLHQNIDEIEPKLVANDMASDKMDREDTDKMEDEIQATEIEELIAESEDSLFDIPAFASYKDDDDTPSEVEESKDVEQAGEINNFVGDDVNNQPAIEVNDVVGGISSNEDPPVNELTPTSYNDKSPIDIQISPSSPEDYDDGKLLIKPTENESPMEEQQVKLCEYFVFNFFYSFNCYGKHR